MSIENKSADTWIFIVIHKDFPGICKHWISLEEGPTRALYDEKYACMIMPGNLRKDARFDCSITFQYAASEKEIHAISSLLYKTYEGIYKEDGWINASHEEVQASLQRIIDDKSAIQDEVDEKAMQKAANNKRWEEEARAKDAQKTINDNWYSTEERRIQNLYGPTSEALYEAVQKAKAEDSFFKAIIRGTHKTKEIAELEDKISALSKARSLEVKFAGIYYFILQDKCQHGVLGSDRLKTHLGPRGFDRVTKTYDDGHWSQWSLSNDVKRWQATLNRAAEILNITGISQGQSYYPELLDALNKIGYSSQS